MPNPVRAGPDDDLVREVRQGGLAGEHAGLELLLRRRPACWEDAVALLGSRVASGHALIALGEAWRSYRRIERTGAVGER